METKKDFTQGLNKRHIAQIIRRNMLQRVKPCGKNYNRKNKKNQKDNDN